MKHFKVQCGRHRLALCEKCLAKSQAAGENLLIFDETKETCIDCYRDIDEDNQCEECGSVIPVVENGGLANKHHRPSCSLYDPSLD